MKRLTAILLTLALLSALATGCAEENVTDYAEETDAVGDSSGEETAEEEDDLAGQLMTLLREAGLDVELLEGEARYDTLSAALIQVNVGTAAQTVTVYYYADEDAAQAAADCFDESGTVYARESGDGTLFAESASSIGTVRLYRWDNAIVRCEGSNETLLSVLADALGEPFADESESPRETDYETGEWLASLLRLRGYDVETEGTEQSGSMYLEDSRDVLSLTAGDEVVVLHYADETTAEAVSGYFDPNDPSEFDTTGNGDYVAVDYIAPIRLYLWERDIVFYCGRDETVIAVLDGALGAPFAYNDWTDETVSETATEADVTAQVEELLSQAGFQIETTLNGEDNLYRADWVDELTVYPSPEEDDPEGDTGTSDSLGTVQIFHYADSQRAAEVAGGFDTADPSLFSMETEEDGEAVAMVVDFVAPIRLYLAEDCIVLYCGDSQGVTDTLEVGLGAPFAPADE